jgi:Leucine-rich repeat (LRR) protein
LFEEIKLDVSRWENLQYFFASRNKLRALPKGVTTLKHLKQLDLSDNQIADFPLHTEWSWNLVAANLKKNKLKEVPTSLLKFKYLRDLFLSHNEIPALPADLRIGDWDELRRIALDGNPIPALPDVLFELGSIYTIYKDHKTRLSPYTISQQDYRRKIDVYSL